MADISKIKLPDGTTYNIKALNATDTKVTQTAADSTNASFPILLAGTADGTTRTEGAKKSPKLAFNPQTTGLEIGSGSFVYTKLASGGLYLYSTGETNPSIEMHPGSLVVGNEDEGHTTIVGGSGGLVLTDSVVCDGASIGEIEFPHTYSDEEQIVGYWVDGSPIYEKTVELSSALTLASNTWTSMEIYNEAIRPLHVVGYNITSAGYAVVTCLLAQYIFSNKRLQFLNARPSASQITGYTIRYIKDEIIENLSEQTT